MRVRTPYGEVRVARLVPSGHKVALRAVARGDAVHKYGQVIGFATAPIAPGDHVHSHYLGVIATVNCSASTVRYIADRFRGDALHDYPTVDGVIALTHKGGCGARYGSREVALLQRTLAGVARHPNVAAYVFVGLGCEINQIQDLVSAQGLEADAPPLLVIQEEGGLLETVEAGARAVAGLLPRAAEFRREPVPASELVVALQCGGSDGWSGVTANPTVGRAADMLVRQGGTVALGETTEVYGAEPMLTRSASST